jgi:hypothetical protein
MTMNAAHSQLLDRIHGLDDDLLILCIMNIGGGPVDQDRRFVRAELLGEYEARNGEDAVDAVMDQLGM